MNNDCAEISVEALRAMCSEQNERLQIIDVREYPEYATGHLAGSILIPLDQLAEKADTLDKSKKTVLVCLSGKRSAKAQAILRSKGLTDICHLSGGLLAWEQNGEALQREARAPWALERQVRLAAGCLVLTGVALSVFVHPGFVGIAGFVGAGLVFASITDWCGMGLMLAKMPWNRPHGDKR